MIERRGFRVSCLLMAALASMPAAADDLSEARERATPTTPAQSRKLSSTATPARS